MTNDTCELQTPTWQAHFDLEHGGNLCRLLHRPTGLEVLRYPPTRQRLQAQPERFGIPVLFPPNRIEDGRFTFEDRQYTFSLNDPENRYNHLHGLVLGHRWELAQMDEHCVVMQYRIKATQGFMHDCLLRLRYDFSVTSVIQRFEVTNESDLNMPVGLGYHTALTMTDGSEVWPTVTGEQWEIVPPRMLPSGRLIELPKDTVPFVDQQEVSLHCPIESGRFNDSPLRGVAITHPTLNQAVIYQVDDAFKHWYFWNEGGGQGFFCAEPLTWMANAMNMALPQSITGVQHLAPKATWSATTQISVQPINP